MFTIIDNFFLQYQINSSSFINKFNKIHCIDIPIENQLIISWLRGQIIYPKFYWANRDHSEELACSGSILIFKPNLKCNYENVFNKMRRILNKNPEVFFCGGKAFNFKKALPIHWKGFNKFYFFIPRYSLKNEKEQITLRIFLWNHEINSVFKTKLKNNLKKMVFQNEQNQITLENFLIDHHNQAVFLKNVPNNEVWNKQIDKVKQNIINNDYQKVVLARESLFCLKQQISCEFLLNIFFKLTNTFDFYLQINKESVFLGRSPELLFKREVNQLYSEAVAGSMPILPDKLKVNYEIKDFLNDNKSKTEHAFVVEYLVEKFKLLCSEYKIPTDVVTISNSNLIHLFSSIKGKIKANITDKKILAMLHPTPAVGGYPKNKIINKLEALELFNRGWYTGSIGVVSKNKTEMAVGIRSMLIYKKLAYLFAGAGIINESVAQAEWQELEYKINYFRNMLGG